MSHPLDPLLRASLSAPPPEVLERLVLERALELARGQAAATAVRSQRARALREIVLRFRQDWLRLHRLGLQLLALRSVRRRGDPA